MFDYSKLAVGDRLEVGYLDKTHVFLVSGFNAQREPLTRLWSMGAWGVPSRFPSDLAGLEIERVIPAAPAGPSLQGVRAVVFTGETYLNRAALKRLGARWVPADKVWRLDLQGSAPERRAWIAGSLPALQSAGCVLRLQGV